MFFIISNIISKSSREVNRLGHKLGLPTTTTATGLLYAVTNAGTHSAGPSSPSQAVMDALAAASSANGLPRPT